MRYPYNSHKKIIAVIIDPHANKKYAQDIIDDIKNQSVDNKNVQLDILYIDDYQLPLLYDKTAPMLQNSIHDPVIKKWSRIIDRANAFIVIAHSVNDSYSAPLKNSFDLLYKEWNSKPCALIVHADENIDTTNTLLHLSKVFKTLKMMPPNNLKTYSIETKSIVKTLLDHIDNMPSLSLSIKIKNFVQRTAQKIFITCINAFHSFINYFKNCTDKKDVVFAVKPIQSGEQKKRIGILLGSTRQERLSPKIGTAVKKIMDKYATVDAQIVDIAAYNIPFYNKEISNTHPSDNKESLIKWKNAVSHLDAIIVVVPEYNGGYPAVLKNAFDTLDQNEWMNKVISFVAYSGGPSGGKNAVNQFIAVVKSRKMNNISSCVFIPYSWKALDNCGKFVSLDVVTAVDKIAQDIAAAV